VYIINSSGKNTSNALGVIDASKGDVKGAIKTLDVTSNNHADAVKMLKSASGDADGAIKVFNKVGKDADIASAVLNKSDGSAVKALDSIDEAKRSVILYLNDDGIEIGHSYKNTGLEGILPDAIPSESKFSIRKMDLDNLPDDVSLSGKIPMYEKLCAADKIQLRYIEGRHLKGEFSDAAVVSVTLDSNGKSKVSYDVNGRVETGELDAGAIRYDVDMNGKISVKCRDSVDGTAVWKSQVGDMIHDSRIESINGIDRAQFSSLDDALKKLDVSDTSKLFGDSISKISSDNTNSMRFVMDVATGRNNIADSVKLDPVNCSKIGARVGVAMAALDTLGDLGDGIDAIIAYNKFAEGLSNGDYVEASYELGEWGARTAGSTLAGMGAGYATGLVIAALAAGGTVLSGGTVLFVVIGTSMVASTAGSELGAALWDDLNYRVNGYGKRDHTKSAVILSILSKAGISVNDKDDVIEGSDLNDELDGGTGNDTLYGGSGSDKYIFRKGDGNDVIYDRGWDNSHNDKIKFVSGVRASDVKIDRVEHDLVISYGSGDGIVVRNQFLDSDCLIESIVFSDGDSWYIGDMAEILQNIVGTEEGDFLKGYVKTLGYYDNEIFHAGAGDDLVEAYTGDDLIYGEDGSDALYGQWGNDTIIGGTGDDYLCGGQGDDIYIYNMGDGFDFIEDKDTEVYNSDKIVLGEGFSVDKVGMERRDNDLIIQLSDNDFIMVKNAYNEWNDGKGFVENIVFSDGHVLRPEDIANRANVHMGSDDDDNMQGYKKAIGYNNDEVFIGGAGGDWIHAYDGDDTVCGEDGDDVIYGEDGNDVIFGGNGKDHIFGENGDDIIQGDHGKDYLSGGGGIDIIYGGEGNDEIYGDSDDDMLYGEDGDDEIGGGHGNDVICGGKGNDYLAGDAGDDTYFFDIGDGSDVICGWTGEDRIVFGEGITYKNVSIERVVDDLEIRYGENDRILVYGAYLWNGSQRFVENIEFSDGVFLDKKAVNHEASIRHGSSGADEIVGYNGSCGYDIDETLYGYGGNDTINANEGNDTIYGGEGDDIIDGSYGD
ncbi:MAG: calcium-binding protein, partial [Lachnospiraceae bacterium]